MTTHIEQQISKGFIHFSAILEMVGKPKEHVDETFAAFIAQMKKSLKYEIVAQNINESILVEGSDSLYSSFAEIEVLAKDMGALFDFCFECMPASVEILAPSELRLKPNQATAVVNDLVSRIHQLDLHAKKTTQQINLYSENLRIMIQNAIVLFLAQKPHTIESISNAVGVSVEQLPPFLKILVEAGRISEANGVYGVTGRSITKIGESNTSVPAVVGKKSSKTETKKSSKKEEVIALGKNKKQQKKK